MWKKRQTERKTERVNGNYEFHSDSKVSVKENFIRGLEIESLVAEIKGVV